MSDIGALARMAYEHGENPLDYAERQLEILITVHLMVMAARSEDVASFPGYPADLGFASLARRILGDLLDAGWTMPGSADEP